MDLTKAIHSRQSIRGFSSKKPDWRNIIECIDILRYAPMAGGNYTLKVIMVDEPKLINKLAEASQQDFISEAKYVVVICSDPKRTVNAYEERGKNFVRQQAGAAIQNFLLKITEYGFSTCWIGYFIEEEIKNILDIPEEIQVEALFPIGFQKEKKRTKKVPIDLNNILYFNEYGNKKMKKENKINA